MGEAGNDGTAAVESSAEPLQPQGSSHCTMNEHGGSPPRRRSGPLRAGRPPGLKASTQNQTKGTVAGAKLGGEPRDNAASAMAVAARPEVEAIPEEEQDGACNEEAKASKQWQQQKPGGGKTRTPLSGENQADEAALVALELLRQAAEERVKTRRRQEAKERKERERRDIEEKEVRHSEAEAKAKELERITRERVQERLRAQRVEEQEERKAQEQMEQERKQKQMEAEAKAKELERLTKERLQERLREQRASEQEGQRMEEQVEQERQRRAAQAAEEMPQHAAQRLARREHAERQKQAELARQEAEARQRWEEGEEARVAQLREKTRLRMQGYTRERREQQQAEERALQLRSEEEAQSISEQQLQAQEFQQRARARAAEFQHRNRLEEEERQRLDEERAAEARLQAEVGKQERQRKRNWRAAEAILPPSRPTPSAGSRTTAPSPPADSHAKPGQIPPKPPLGQAGHSSAQEATHGIAKHVRQPLWNGQRNSGVCSEQRAARSAERYSAQSSGHHQASAVEGQRSRFVDDEQVVQGPVRGISPMNPNMCPAPAANDDGAIQCTVAFFGIGCEPLDNGEESEHPDAGSALCSAAVQHPPSSEVALKRQPPRSPSRGKPSSQASLAAVPNYEQAPALPVAELTQAPAPVLRAAAPPRTLPRACSQPPPSRSPMAGDGISAASPLSRRAEEPSGDLTPTRPMKRVNPWRQKAVQVQPTDYYLELIKAARNDACTAGKHSGLASRGEGYSDQLRQRAHDVEAAQRKEEAERYERGYAVLERVQKRALQAAPSRSASCDV